MEWLELKGLEELADVVDFKGRVHKYKELYKQSQMFIARLVQSTWQCKDCFKQFRSKQQIQGEGKGMQPSLKQALSWCREHGHSISV